jgi:DNA-binding MarR family transcriptional regulator
VSDDPDTFDSAQGAWLQMCSVVLANDRRRRVADALGMSFGRVRALRQITLAPTTMGELALGLGIDPPYMTLLVDDLEARRLVARHDHPRDRRAKLVVATDQGLELARRAEEILGEPPPGLTALSRDELGTLERILLKVERLEGASRL